MHADLSNRAKEIIAQISYITLATTCPDGSPWNSPVFAAYDNDFNFYFGTHKGSQKARNIDASPNVFIVVYDSTAQPGTGEGVFIKAKAEVLKTADEIQSAHALLWARHTVPYWKLEEFEPDSPLALYKVMPEAIWMNDESLAGGHYIDVRTSIHLVPDERREKSQ